MTYENITHLHRRRFLALSVSAAATPFMPRSGWAFGSETHSTMVGDIELTVISDGHLTIPSAVLAPNAPKEEFEAFMTGLMGSVPETVQPETNHALLRVGGETILIDNGSGKKFQPTAGKLLENLSINGIDPASINKVVFTHAHPDHVWGTLLEDGSLALPNATYYVGETEFAFWTDPETEGMMPDDFKPFAQGARRDLLAVQDRVQLVKEGDGIAAGVSVLDTPGHTPGHISVLVDGGDGLIITGDAMASEFLSVQHPDWAFGFDSIPDMAIASRKALLDRVATDGHRVLGYHFAYPGIGNIEKASEGYRFTAS
ncbi:MBL fold metallo-hydrolase [Aliiruegeria lutimaris]|uniref:Glyoxylase, beta-lactamase superfamily II n=1 Tax=Aliiruegeria lutimaris TaxID=571298 RepID=A0A1G9B8F5_9RHOB|nr:MBL fold metallo-hydrolase [Aliiruegeria lutimaris]SDK35135.1 Glyoxylase, beta-lactamase superfamily II [Aliiruegeria lutimaris]